MGLNETFANARSQVLLMDPISSINRVFALISQEEKQQTPGGQFSTPQESLHGMSMFAKSDQLITKNQRKERPLCAHCKILGHTFDKCYKLHGYPLGYKPRLKKPAIAANIESSELPHQSLEQPMVTLSEAQYNQLLAALSARLLGSSSSPSTREASSGVVTAASGYV